MKRLSGYNQVERSFVLEPFLERRADHTNERKAPKIFTRGSSQVLAQFDSHNLVATLGKRQRYLAGAAPDFQDAGIRCELGPLDQLVDQLRRIFGTSDVVSFWLFIKNAAVFSIEHLIIVQQRVSDAGPTAVKPGMQYQPPGVTRNFFGGSRSKANPALLIDDVQLGRCCMETFIGGPQGHPCEKR